MVTGTSPSGSIGVWVRHCVKPSVVETLAQQRNGWWKLQNSVLENYQARLWNIDGKGVEEFMGVMYRTRRQHDILLSTHRMIYPAKAVRRA